MITLKILREKERDVWGGEEIKKRGFGMFDLLVAPC